MPKKAFTPEQIVAKLRHIEVLLSQGKTVPLACKEAGIVDQTYYRWRKEFGGLQLEQAKKLKDLQKENAQLKRALATVTLEKQVLKDIAEGNVWSAPLFASVKLRSDIVVCVNVSGLSRVGRFGDQAMMRFAHAVPNNLVRSRKNQFPNPGLQHADQPLCHPCSTPQTQGRRTLKLRPSERSHRAG